MKSKTNLTPLALIYILISLIYKISLIFMKSNNNNNNSNQKKTKNTSNITPDLPSTKIIQSYHKIINQNKNIFFKCLLKSCKKLSKYKWLIISHLEIHPSSNKNLMVPI
jgi:hypothetical protein